MDRKLLKELAEAIRQMRLAFPSNAGPQYRSAADAIDAAEAELGACRMGLLNENIVPIISERLRVARSVFRDRSRYQSAVSKAELALAYLD
jgi:hypothetical protein